jgi:hypothetical protein
LDKIWASKKEANCLEAQSEEKGKMHQVDVCFTESAFISDLSSVPVAVLLQFSLFLARFICFSLPLIALATAW